jgi:hypothetical protein
MTTRGARGCSVVRDRVLLLDQLDQVGQAVNGEGIGSIRTTRGASGPSQCLPALQPGVVHVVLLPAEGSLQQQLQPLICQPMMVLPGAAAAEM